MLDLLEIIRGQRNNVPLITFSTEISDPVDVPTTWNTMRMTYWFNEELRTHFQKHCVLEQKPLKGKLQWVTPDGKFHCCRFVLTFDIGADFPWNFEFEAETVT